jgi:hypothetical protein
LANQLKLNYSGVNYESAGLRNHIPKNDEDRARGYTAGPWQSFLVFRCCLCGMDSFNESEIAHHVFTRHHQADPPAYRPAATLLFDPSGKPVENIPVSASTPPPPPPPPEEAEAIRADDPALEKALESLLPDLEKSGLIEPTRKKKA